MPLGLEFPQHVVFKIEASLPRTWFIQNEQKKIEGDAFYFRSNVAGGLNKLTLEYEYKTLSDSVPVESMPDYLRHLDDAWQNLGYSIRL